MIAAAITAGLTIVLLAHVYQFGEAAPGDARQILAAPQASIMKALVVGFMSHQPVAYMLFGIGAIITLILEMLGKSSMVFALGIYLPLDLTSPVLAGGILSHIINRRSEKTGGEPGEQDSRARGDSGLGADGGRRAGRRAGRGAAPVPLVSRGSDHHAVLQERSRLAIGFRGCCLLDFVCMSGFIP